MTQTPSGSPNSPLRLLGGGSLVALILAVIIFAYRALTGSAAGPTPAASTPDWYAVYFSDPSAPAANSLRGGPDQYLARAIDGARLSVDVAAYNLDLWSLRDALRSAHRRGVKVRLVTDSDYLDNPEIQDLQEAGIEVLGDRRESLMHNKFVVIDRLEVWTGSMNFTVNGAYRNDNNLIRLRSSRLAEDYSAEFEEMFSQDLFGSRLAPGSPYPVVTIEGSRVEVFFSPEDDTAERVVALIEQAQSSVRFLAYSFTSDPLARAFQQASRRGVLVQGVMEAEQVRSNVGSEYDFFRRSALEVRLDGNPNSMHHKVLVIDERFVVAGSYNFSANAEDSNDENLLILENARLAALYLGEFERVWGEAGSSSGLPLLPVTGLFAGEISWRNMPVVGLE